MPKGSDGMSKGFAFIEFKNPQVRQADMQQQQKQGQAMHSSSLRAGRAGWRQQQHHRQGGRADAEAAAGLMTSSHRAQQLGECMMPCTSTNSINSTDSNSTSSSSSASFSRHMCLIVL